MNTNKTSDSAKRATKKYMKKRYNNDDEYCEKIKEYNRNWHKSEIGQTCRAKHYDENKEIIKMKRRYSYWKSKGDLEKYKKKYPDDIPKLIEIGHIEE